MLRNYNDFANAFEVICQLAEKNDFKNLNEFITNTGVSINLSFDNRISPVAYLAQQNKSNAVEFLLQNFHANINDAAYGYALSGLDDKVDMMLKRGAIHLYAIFAYALSGNHEQIILRYDNDDGKQFTSNNYIPLFAAFGYAISGRKELLMKVLDIDHDLYDKLIQNNKDNLLDFYHRMRFLVRCSYYDLSEYFDRDIIDGNNHHNTDSEEKSFYHFLSQGPDCSDEIIDLVQKCMNKSSEKIDRLVNSINNINLIIFLFLNCGFTKELCDLIEQDVKFDDRAALSYLMNGSLELLNLLIDANINIDALLAGCAAGRMLQNNADSIIKILSIINDDEIRHQAACILQPIYENIDMEKLCIYAGEINKLMQSYYLNFQQALTVIENNALIWLTEGKQVCKQRNENMVGENALPLLNNDVYMEISRHLLNQNLIETKLIIKQLETQRIPSKVGLFRSLQMTSACCDAPANEVERPSIH